MFFPSSTFPFHKFLQELIPGARFWVHLCHLVEMVIRDSHILGVSGHIDYLQERRQNVIYSSKMQANGPLQKSVKRPFQKWFFFLCLRLRLVAIAQLTIVFHVVCNNTNTNTTKGIRSYVFCFLQYTRLMLLLRKCFIQISRHPPFLSLFPPVYVDRWILPPDNTFR